RPAYPPGPGQFPACGTHHGKIKKKGKGKGNGKSNGGWLAASALRAKRPAFALVVDFPWWVSRRDLSKAGWGGRAGA
ncbi:hypothetical protein, partial [Stenotrophomonas geniculata]|uniref:hypothetical protein n=1 Tax=Stenotrophomonas geniculata TaxID=86188 RepID=UPI001E344D43